MVRRGLLSIKKEVIFLRKLKSYKAARCALQLIIEHYGHHQHQDVFLVFARIPALGAGYKDTCTVRKTHFKVHFVAFQVAQHVRQEAGIEAYFHVFTRVLAGKAFVCLIAEIKIFSAYLELATCNLQAHLVRCLVRKDAHASHGT